MTVWTLGHSTRQIGDFLSVVKAHDIELIADVRRFPGSRRLPQFEARALAAALRRRRVEYRWLEALGGRRRPDPVSTNLGWRNPAFRAYADHMASEEFANGLTELLMLAPGCRTAVMCAEVLWWRCHRRIIADVLVSLGVSVVHLRDASKGELHQLVSPARMVRGHLSYTRE
ncbi:MAG: DUF488 domain-containing protein [Vicinamibacterales bacterium]